MCSSDIHGGALNDLAMQQYAEIEEASGLTKVSQGHGMLHKRWKMTEARSVANDLVTFLFDILHGLR